VTGHAPPSRRRFRVAHLITRLELGGAQQNTLYCTRHHDRERFEVHLLAGAGGMLDDEARSIPDAEVRLLPSLRHPIRPLQDLLVLFQLRGYLARHRIDLLHTHSSKAGILGRVAGWLAGVPVIVHTVHGWSFNATQPKRRRALFVGLERLVAPLTARLIVVASRNREEGLAEGVGRPDQYQVVHSGIDIEAFEKPGRPAAEVRRELGFDAGSFVVGTVACLKPQKAPLDFVRAAALACEKDDRLRFFIAGDGGLRPRVEASIREHGLASRVRLLGWREDVADLLHASDLFLLTSRFEGLPRAVLQALAAGVPVVATAVDGTPEVIEDGLSGLLVPPGEPEQAARAVLRMAADRELRERCVARGRERLGAAFDIRRMVIDLDRTYLSLLRSPTEGRSERPTIIAAR
jgi:glycosyltransferase involved in cell wall biosynthesis